MIEKEHGHWSANVAALVAVLLAFSGGSARGLEFPGPGPGEAKGTIDGTSLALKNDMLSFAWETSEGRLKPASATNKLSAAVLRLAKTECFQIVLASSPLPGSRIVKASDLAIVGQPELKKLKPDNHSPRLAERFGGKQIVVNLASSDGNLRVQWRVVLRDGSNYVRQHVLLDTKDEAVEVTELVLLELAAPGAEVVGSVDGSPVVAGNMFFACEHPMSKARILSSSSATGNLRQFRCSYPCNALVKPGEPLAYSSVVGVVPEGQLRRGFLWYLERERAHPYRPFLHHNNGYEIGAEYWRKLKKDAEEAKRFRQRQEQTWLKAIGAFGQELVKKRGVVIDSFVHDWVWDDETLVWQFHSGYPNGFAPARRAAEKLDARLGVWFSPFGGYPGKAARIESGRKQGFETNGRGLSLAGPRYYARVRTACVNMVRKYDVNYFKFDGFGAGNNQPGAGQFRSDVEALLRLIGQLRRVNPEVFVNPSTGTWPSPFWLRYADAIWRQGSNSGVLGKGSVRQQWITYRDSEVYHRILERAPLYPINSLMLHGVYINHFPFGNPFDPKVGYRPTYASGDIIDEIRSFFGTGTNLQELYITPELMTPETWDALAEAAKWSRANSDVLVDTHWIGGDPAKAQVYGWASWSKRKSILVLRNPDDRAAEFTLDIGKAFELPKDAPQKYALRSPWKQDVDKPAIEVSAGRGHRLELKPFEVLVFDASVTSAPGAVRQSKGGLGVRAHLVIRDPGTNQQ